METEQKAADSSAVFVPSRWQVVLSLTHPVTGEVIPVARHDCRDLLHARTLLAEMRELAADIAEWLPGLTAEGYALAEAQAAPVPAPAVPDNPILAAVAGWLTD